VIIDRQKTERIMKWHYEQYPQIIVVGMKSYYFVAAPGLLSGAPQSMGLHSWLSEISSIVPRT